MVRAWSGLDNHPVRSSTKHGTAAGVRRTKGCAVAAQPAGKAATTAPSYLRAAEVADIIAVDGDPEGEPGLLCDPDRIWLVARAGMPIAGAAFAATI